MKMKVAKAHNFISNVCRKLVILTKFRRVMSLFHDIAGRLQV